MFGAIKEYFLEPLNSDKKTLEGMRNRAKGAYEFDYEITVTIDGELHIFYCIYKDTSIADELEYL